MAAPLRAATGLSPKQFARVERCARLRSACWDRAARRGPVWRYSPGYADQAHLVREFTELTGLSPEAFLARIRATAHGKLEW